MTERGLRDFLQEFVVDPNEFEDRELFTRTNLCRAIFDNIKDLKREQRDMLLKWAASATKSYDLYEYIIQFLCKDFDDLIAINEGFHRLYEKRAS